MRQVLVTGATGFIGRNLCPALARRGYRVKALVRSLSKARAVLDASQLRILEGDITSPRSLENAVEPGDLVIHLAARYADPSASYEMYWDTNVVGTEHLVRVSMARSVERFIHCSTIGVALNGGEPPFDEEAPYSAPPDDFYEVTKCAAEKLVLEGFRESGFPVVVLRPVQPFGPGDLRKVKFYKLVKRGITVGSGRVPKHLIYIDDLVTAFEIAMSKEGIEGEVIIVGGQPVVQLHEMIAWVAEELGISAPRFRIPVLPMKVLVAAVERVCRRLGLRPPIDRSRLSLFTRGYYFDTSKAATVLGFEPQISVREGIGRTVKWYQNNGLL